MFACLLVHVRKRRESRSSRRFNRSCARCAIATSLTGSTSAVVRTIIPPPGSSMQRMAKPLAHPASPRLARCRCRRSWCCRRCRSSYILRAGSHAGFANIAYRVIEALFAEAAQRGDAFFGAGIGALAQRQNVAEGAAAAVRGFCFEGLWRIREVGWGD